VDPSLERACLPQGNLTTLFKESKTKPLDKGGEKVRAGKKSEQVMIGGGGKST